jgi:methionyl-tRNA formyltransferase
VHRAVIAGDAETGVTIMRVVKALDAGPMLATVRVPIGPDDTTPIVESILAIRGAELLIQTLDAIEAGAATETPQDESSVTYAPKLTKPEGQIDWSMPSQRIHDLVRGLWPWPHAFTHLSGMRYIIHRSRVSHQSTDNASPGTIVSASTSEGLHVACGEGTAIELIDIQLEGKRVMNARALMASKALVAGARFSTP